VLRKVCKLLISEPDRILARHPAHPVQICQPIERVASVEGFEVLRVNHASAIAGRVVDVLHRLVAKRGEAVVGCAAGQPTHVVVSECVSTCAIRDLGESACTVVAPCSWLLVRWDTASSPAGSGSRTYRQSGYSVDRFWT